MQLEHVLDYDVALEPPVPIGPGPMACGCSTGSPAARSEARG